MRCACDRIYQVDGRPKGILTCSDVHCTSRGDKVWSMSPLPFREGVCKGEWAASCTLQLYPREDAARDALV